MGQGALSKPVVQWWLSLNSSTSLRASASGVQCFVGVSVTIGDDLLFVCDDRCAKQPLLNQSRMMK